jgi:hypothetical protein
MSRCGDVNITRSGTRTPSLTYTFTLSSFSLTQIHESKSIVTQKSHKQGHSHRKVRRWNNDHFDRLASEIATCYKNGDSVAHLLLQAKEHAHLYKAIIDHKDRRSELFQR